MGSGLVVRSGHGLAGIGHRLLRHGLRDFLVLSEPLAGHAGPSVTNGIAGYVAAAIELYGIRPTARLVVIEHYERQAPADDTFDHVSARFDDSGVSVSGWKPLTPELAALLERAGQPLSRHVGQKVVIDTGALRVSGQVLRYDGRRYHLKGMATPVHGTVIEVG